MQSPSAADANSFGAEVPHKSPFDTGHSVAITIRTPTEMEGATKFHHDAVDIAFNRLAGVNARSNEPEVVADSGINMR